MTNQEINLKIAKLCGKDKLFAVWECQSNRCWFYRAGEFGYTEDIKEAEHYTKETAKKMLGRSEYMGIALVPVPNYTENLNDMHDAEKTLTTRQRNLFIYALGLDVLKLCPLAGDYWMAGEVDSWMMTNASARQRAEAFLQVFEKEIK